MRYPAGRTGERAVLGRIKFMNDLESWREYCKMEKAMIANWAKGIDLSDPFKTRRPKK
jgi:hypothetical protein